MDAVTHLRHRPLPTSSALLSPDRDLADDDRPTIAALVGSLRRRSYNRRLLAYLCQQLADVAVVVDADVSRLPYFDEDIELAGAGLAVRRFKELIRAADAVMVVTPEYNGSVPGVLKNAIDWASRPFMSAPLSAKPSVVLTATRTRGGGAGARRHLREILESADCDVVADVGLPRIDRCWLPDGCLDASTRRRVDQAVNPLLEIVAGRTTVPRQSLDGERVLA